jgi:hypothetical protein
MRGRGWRLILAALACFVFIAEGDAQDVSYVRRSRFPIPFSIDPADVPRVREVQLYLSDDQGRSWRIYRVAGPGERDFPFQADRDGHYWFIIRTLSTDGRLEPASLDHRGPDLRVVIDTRPPQISLQALPSQGDLVGVAWDVQDDNLDLGSLTLEARPLGGDWQTVDIEKTAAGRKMWAAQARGDLDVRLRARDRADNANTGFVSLRQGSGGSGPAGYDSAPGRSTPAAGLPTVMYVNSLDVQFKFQVEEAGPSGISTVDVYYTRDGPNWKHYGEDPNREPPIRVEDLHDNATKLIRARLPQEGQYGLILLPRSGVGMAAPPPQRGERPMIWVEVDTTRPVVQLLEARPTRTPDGTVLAIAWRASDKNLEQAPITLYYAERPDGPWQPIERNLENTGRYVWRIPPESPFRFSVRVEARDKANNLGMRDSEKPVIVDLVQPRIKLLNVEPAAAGGYGGPAGPP